MAEQQEALLLLEVWSLLEVHRLLEVLPPLEALPLLEVVPLGKTQGDTTSRLRPATIPSHSHQFPLQLTSEPKVTRSHQHVKSFGTPHGLGQHPARFQLRWNSSRASSAAIARV